MHTLAALVGLGRFPMGPRCCGALGGVCFSRCDLPQTRPLAVDLRLLVLVARPDGGWPRLARTLVRFSAEVKIQIQSGVRDRGSLTGRPQADQLEVDSVRGVAADMTCDIEAEKESEHENRGMRRGLKLLVII